MGMNNRELENWLAELPVLTHLPQEREQAVMELLGGQGLGTLLGLLLGTRQALLVQLSRYPLGSDENCWYASVLQGKIQGLELVADTVRELGVPSSGEEKEPRT